MNFNEIAKINSGGTLDDLKCVKNSKKIPFAV